MKKYLVLAVVCLMTVMASAQNFKIKSVDAHANLRSDFGLGAGVTMGVDVFDFAPSFNYYFSDGSNVWTIDADFHYNFDLAKDVKVYPIAGLAILHAGGQSMKTDLGTIEVDGQTKLGGNIGAGVAYQLTDQWAAKAEAKYQFIKHYDDLYLSVGVSYCF